MNVFLPVVDCQDEWDAPDFVGPFEVAGETLSDGPLAEVRRAWDTSGKQYVVKILNHKSYKRQREWRTSEDGKAVVLDGTSKMKNEIKMLNMIRSQPHLVGLCDGYKVITAAGDFFYLFLEYKDIGSILLTDANEFPITFRPPICASSWPIDAVKQFIWDIASGLAILHSSKLNIAHRDVKPQNILLSSNGMASLADFGSSQEMSEDGQISNTTEGTYPMLAPECVATDPTPTVDGRKVDIWALGCTLFILMTGSLPFDSPALDVLFERIATAGPPHGIDRISDEKCRQLVLLMLAKDPGDRPTAEEIMHSDWVADRSPREWLIGYLEKARIDGI